MFRFIHSIESFFKRYTYEHRCYHNVSHAGLLRASHALLKFCRDHGYSEGGLEHLTGCIAALESDDFKAAVKHFREMHFGGMGRFDDWFPPVICEHEDGNYVWSVFEALLERWIRLMRTAAGDLE